MLASVLLPMPSLLREVRAAIDLTQFRIYAYLQQAISPLVLISVVKAKHMSSTRVVRNGGD